MRARNLLLKLTLWFGVVIATFAGSSRPAAAHNTFVSSDPATGAVVDSAPRQISFVFAAPVPLETASAQVIDGLGTRTDLTGLTHGPAGSNEFVAPLPPLEPGEITVRWRLVGPDGHPLTDRVVFTVRAPATTTAAAAVPADTSVPAVPSSGPGTASMGAAELRDDAPSSVPGPVRWLLRASAYVAIMTMVGVAVTDALVWPGAMSHPALRVCLRRATGVVLATAVAQLLVLGSDIAGGLPSLDDLQAAGATSAGGALILRLLLAITAWLLIVAPGHAHPETRWSVLSLTGVGLLGTWAFAGHAASQRWPHVGVTLDVLHHLAAASWVGSLAVVGLVAARETAPNELGRTFRRLSRWATVAVTVLVATGFAQSVRLVGSVGDVFATRHGRYLAVKIAVLAVMLAIANGNRRRVSVHLGRTDSPPRATVAALRRGVAWELVAGGVIVAVTAAMVVSPPGASS